MKILMIAPEPFFEPRGTPFSIYERTKALSELSYQIDLVTYHVGEDVDFPGMTLYRIPRVPFIKQVKVGPSWAKPILDILIFFVVLRRLLGTRYDVIHSHEEAAFIALFLGKIFRTPHLYDMHSSLPRQLENFKFGNWWWLVRTFELLENWVLNSCDAVITIGADLEKLVKQINPDVPQMMIHNIPLSNTNRTRDSHSLDELKRELNIENVRPIVYTGTFETYQGLDLLVDCAEQVVNQFPTALFIMVGGKPKQIEILQAEVHKRKLDDSFYFAGTVTPDESLDYLELAEVLVSPRIYGTSVPLKIYSYLYSEKPIVATNLLAHTMVLDEEVAVLVEPKKEDLAEGICLCLREEEWSGKMAARARSLALEKYGQETYLSKVREIYKLFLPRVELPEPEQAPETVGE